MTMSRIMDKQKYMDRRSFLKHLGIGSAATATALAGCKNNNNPVAGNITAQGEVPTHKMTYRLNPKSGEKVSLLGYGCMRWPVMPDPAGEGEIIDQEAVNSLVDYALAHGINYFDTAPPYFNTRLKQRRPAESIASWAFRFAGSFPNVLTVLSGMTYMEHLQDNIRTYAPLDACSDEELALLEDTAQIMLKYESVPCTAQYCMPCPYGLDIPGIFAHYNKCINEGNVPSSSQSSEYRKARRAFLVGYDRSVPRLRQANHCIGCRECVSHCPQNIEIPAQMQRIDNFVEQLKQNKV